MNQKVFVCVAFLMILLINPASSQLMNLHELTEGEKAIGLGYGYNRSSFLRDCGKVHTLMGAFDYGYNDTLKFSVIPNFSWTTEMDRPIPWGVKLRFMHIGKTWSFLGYFFRSDWEAGYAKCSGGSVMNLLATNSFGGFLRLANEPIWTIKPFLGISQSTIRHMWFDIKDNSSLICRGNVGVEIEIMQYFSIIGDLEFTINRPTVFHIVANFFFQ